MKRLAFALCACLGLVVATSTPAAEPAVSPPPDAEAAKPLAEQLKEQPDDSGLFNKYMVENLRRLGLLMSSDPDQAEKQLEEMTRLIESLQPETDAGKEFVRRAKMTVEYYQGRLELARTTLEEAAANLSDHPGDTKAISLYAAKLTAEVSPLTRSEPDRAEEMLNGAKQLLAEIREKLDDEAAKKALESLEQPFQRLEQQIEMGKRLAALVGSDAAPLQVETWVNGDPLTDEDLKGKVVLLDFWAVWCGPCIATFPHLREWRETYADKGLVIIGLTRYYGYEWDEESGRPKRGAKREDVTPEHEQEMLVKFAEQHELKHRFAIQNGQTLSQHYVVTGIPHVVLIDREGKVRLFRIGSGAQNARDISEMLEQLMGDA